VARKLQTLLIAELHHRVKNLLSMVLSITSQTLRVAPSLEEAREAIQSRIMILSRSFDLLAQGELDAAPLSSVIENAAEPYNETHALRCRYRVWGSRPCPHCLLPWSSTSCAPMP
jgi:two-component sensor histidine kinase